MDDNKIYAVVGSEQVDIELHQLFTNMMNAKQQLDEIDEKINKLKNFLPSSEKKLQQLTLERLQLVF